MVEIIKSSFIPKKEIKRNAEKRSGSGISIFLLISLVIFLATVIGGIGMSFWKTTLEKENIKKTKILDEKSERYGIGTFTEFLRINKKIHVAETLLNSHYAVYPIFEYLNKATIRDIVYTKMTLREDGNYVVVEASGKAMEIFLANFPA